MKPLHMLALVPGLLLFVPAAPARAADVTLTDLRYDLGFGTITVPRLEVRGTDLTEAELRGIIGPGTAITRDGFARLNADSVSAPEVVFDQKLPDGTNRIVYRGLAASGIKAGVFERVASEGAEGVVTGGRSDGMRIGFGASEIEGLDLAFIGELLTTAAPDPAAAEMRPILRRGVYRDYTAETPLPASRMHIREIRYGSSRAKLGARPLGELLTELMTMAESLPPRGGTSGSDSSDGTSSDITREITPEQRSVISSILLLMNQFEYGQVELEGLRGEVKADGVHVRQAATFAIAGMSYSDLPGNGHFSMGGFDVEAGPVKFGLDRFEARDFSFGEAIGRLAALVEADDLASLATGWQQLIPKLGRITLEGFRVEAPERRSRPRDGQPPEIIRINLKSAEVGVPSQLDGVPTAVRASVEGLAFNLPANPRDEGARNLRAMGYTALDLSGLVDMAWQEATQRLDINALTFSGKDMVSFGLAGRVDNLSRDAFSTDAAVAQVAWLSAAAQALRVRLENHGMIEKIIANEARKQGKTPDAFRRDLGAMAALALPAILGDSDGAKALSGALAKFLARPGKIDIEARSLQASGIGAADVFAAMGQPQSIFEKLEVKATAE